MLPRMGVLSKKRTTKNGRVIGGKALVEGYYKQKHNKVNRLCEIILYEST